MSPFDQLRFAQKQANAAAAVVRLWEQQDIVLRVDQTPLPYNPDREWFTLAIVTGTQTFFQTYVVIHSGEYEIGSPVDESWRYASEIRNRVRITRPYAILDREITRGEFEASGITNMEADRYSTAANYPMVAVTWYESVAYCRWLTEQVGFPESDQAYADPATVDKAVYPLDAESGYPINWPMDMRKPGFRLPTEAEWGIAARGGMKSMYGFGGDGTLLRNYAWYQDNSNHQTHLAKELRPNFRGLFDMHENLYEWSHDWYAGYSTTSTQVDPKGGQNGDHRVNRGGGWINDAAGCRSAHRSSSTPTYRSASSGLRLALSPSIQSPDAEGIAEPVGIGTEGVAEQRP